MKCIKCHHELDTSQKFCQYCGTPVEISLNENKKQDYMLKCKVCGSLVKPGNIYCTSCGAPMDKAGVVQQGGKKGKKKKNGKGIAFVKVFLIVTMLTAAALIALVVLNYVNLGNRDKDRISDTTISEHKTDDSGTDEGQTNGGSEDNDQAEPVESTIENNIDDSDLSTNTNHQTDVEQIVEEHNDLISSMTAADYDFAFIDKGITAYYENDDLKIVTAAIGSGNDDYARTFYYSGDEVIFAQYKGDDAHQFYLENNQLIRWRYFSDAEDKKNATNYDLENMSEYQKWESRVVTDAMKLKGAWEAAESEDIPETVENRTQEYMLVGSDTRYISESELKNLTREEVRIARNEIYARHGRKFDDKTLSNYFKQFDWYKPKIDPEDFKESMLNTYEVANRDLIIQYEKKKGW